MAAVRGEQPADVDVEEISRALEEIAAVLRELWDQSLATGDVDQVTRLLEASHGVHRAAIALRGPEGDRFRRS